MDDVTTNHLKKDNSVRTNLSLVTYANCRQISMARKNSKLIRVLWKNFLRYMNHKK